MSRKLSICALFFGDYPALAERCLGSIQGSLENGAKYIQDFRLACNAACPATQDLVRRFADDAASKYQIPTRLFFAANVCKYPMMRRMFYTREELAPATMWFDDDSYFKIPQPAGWWESLQQHLDKAGMLGQFWLMPIQGNQWQWVCSRPWYNASVGLPPKKHHGKHCFEFCQGAWWVIHSEILRRYDWPVAEIRHNGGDSMLGELFRHQGLKMSRFHGGVHINADDRGRASKADRRGTNEKRVGWDFNGKPLAVSHQWFDYDTELVSPPIKTAVCPQNSTEPIINLYGNDDGNQHPGS